MHAYDSHVSAHNFEPFVHEGKNGFQIEINLFNMQFFYVLVLIYDYDYDFVCLLFINRRSYVGW